MRGGPPAVILPQDGIKPLSGCKYLWCQNRIHKGEYLGYNAPPHSERWMSGLSHHPGKVAYASVYRGFESLPLRQFGILISCLLMMSIDSCPSRHNINNHDAGLM